MYNSGQEIKKKIGTINQVRGLGGEGASSMVRYRCTSVNECNSYEGHG